MGVSGCGKTTVGKQLSLKIGLPFFDADDFHPKSNIEKMKNNIPLNDEDRLPWLELLSEKIKDWESSGGGILACSALKETYRKVLSSNTNNIYWVYLYGSIELINDRMRKRGTHYMKRELLQSQFDTLEVPNYGFHISVEKNVEDIINDISSKIK